MALTSLKYLTCRNQQNFSRGQSIGFEAAAVAATLAGFKSRRSLLKKGLAPRQSRDARPHPRRADASRWPASHHR